MSLLSVNSVVVDTFLIVASLFPGFLHSLFLRTHTTTLWIAICMPPAAVVITFFAFWAPFHAQRLLFLYGQEWEHFKTVNEWLFMFGGTLYYVSW